jgi:hypothetical protein
VRRIRTSLPFTIQLPADGRFKLANDVPNFDGAHCVAADKRECREEVNAKNLVPKLGNRVFRVEGANGFLRRWVSLELTTGQNESRPQNKPKLVNVLSMRYVISLISRFLL